jgi:hypothetical protein
MIDRSNFGQLNRQHSISLDLRFGGGGTLKSIHSSGLVRNGLEGAIVAAATGDFSPFR